MNHSDVGLFFGRFHAVVVHLPIGIILLGVVFYGLNVWKKSAYIKQSLPVVFLFATISAAVSVIFGLLLADKGGFSSGSVFWHKWLGIGVMLVSFFTWLAFSRKSAYAKWLVVALSGLVLATGHLGGGLTHGDNYLSEHAPLFLKPILGGTSASSSIIEHQLFNPDTIVIYMHILQPVLHAKCASCHNEEDMEGGDSGAAIAMGSLNQSELYNRLTLEATNNKFMPVKGVPFTYHEVKLLEYWIQSGSEEKQAITQEDIPKDISELIEQHFGFSTSQKSYIEMATIDAASEESINELKAIGFLIQPISRSTNFLSVTAADSVTLDQLKQLKKVKSQVAWLDLHRCNLQDGWLEKFLQFPNLTKLNVSENPISTIEAIVENDRLEKLNLHSTMIGDTDLQPLIPLKNLRRLYVWNTSVTGQGLDSFKLKRGDVILE
jgi:hypothetical protein